MVVQGHPRSESACHFSLVIKSLQFQHNLGPVLHRLKNVAGFLLKTVIIQTDKRTDRIMNLYILPLIIWVYFHSNFSIGLRKTIFSTRVRLGHSRSSKVIDVGTNRKRVCDFLLVRHSNLAPFRRLQVFALMTPPLFHPNFGVVPVAPDQPCWGHQPERKVANQT